jgi:hypothetical protein
MYGLGTASVGADPQTFGSPRSGKISQANGFGAARQMSENGKVKTRGVCAWNCSAHVDVRFARARFPVTHPSHRGTPDHPLPPSQRGSRE